MYMSTQNRCSPATFLFETESRNTQANSEQNMAMMASDGPSPHSPSLRLGLPGPQPSRRHHAQSLLGPSFHDPRTHHVLESHRERAAPFSRRDDERCHRLSLRPCTAPVSCSLQHLLVSLKPSLPQYVSIVSPHSPFLRCGLPAPQPSKRHHTQSLLGPSFHYPGTHHVLESHPEQAAPVSRRDDERRHAVGFHSALALRLYLAACNPSASCRL